MTTEFVSTIIGLGEDNEVIASSSYYHKRKKESDFINYSFSTGEFTYLDIREGKYKDKIKKDYLQFLEQENLKEKAEFFENEFKSMKNIRKDSDITWFEEGFMSEIGTKGISFKSRYLNEHSIVTIAPQLMDGSIKNEHYSDINFVFGIPDALTEKEKKDIFSPVIYRSKDRVKLLFSFLNTSR